LKQLAQSKGIVLNENENQENVKTKDSVEELKSDNLGTVSVVKEL
jgi:hypothetical protein